MSSETKVWFITGCSSGFGLCIAQHALNRGDKVVATILKPEAPSELATNHPHLLVLTLDVTKPADVTAAFAASKAMFGRIDVVVNNAGFAFVGEVEGTPESVARALFDVNFWGAARVSREAIRFFRDENKPNGGRLLQISSFLGIKSWPGAGYQSASKFALEGLSEGLAEELHPSWNIKITLLQPGPFRTKVVANTLTEPVHPAYATTDPKFAGMQRRDFFQNPDQVLNGDPKKFAEVVYRVAYLEDPPLRLPIHPVSLTMLREKGKSSLEIADKWESWSEGVLLED